MNIESKNTIVAQKLVNGVGLDEFYNINEKELVQPFLNEILVTDDINRAKYLSINFQNVVVESTLTREEKIKLLSLAVSIQVICEYIEKADYESIKVVLNNYGAINDSPYYSRVAGCSVNARSVLAGAVVGGLVGGASGCYAGAIGGTLALSGVGTVAGCAGLDMLGLASDFFGGVIQGVASELITSCGR